MSPKIWLIVWFVLFFAHLILLVVTSRLSWAVWSGAGVVISQIGVYSNLRKVL